MNSDQSVHAQEAARRLLPLIPYLPIKSLVDLALIGNSACHQALASAEKIAEPVSAVLAELGDEQSLLMILNNPKAKVADFSFIRMVERFSASEDILGALEQRTDLNENAWSALVTARLRTILAMVEEANGADKMEQALIALLWTVDAPVRQTYIKTLIRFGRITPHLLRFALANGANEVVVALLASLTGQPRATVEEIFAHSDRIGFRGLLKQAGIPAAMIPACEADFLRATVEPASLFADAA
jgi:uncharacterized protein (DUF2336 family)